MALPTDRVLVATNCSAAAAHPKGFAWTCIVVGTQLRVATPSAVLVPIELHCNPTAAVIVRSEVSTDLVAEYAVTYTATVVLSLPGDRYFECVLRVSDGACSATSIRETFFQVPCERPSAAPVSTKEPARRRTRTELPWCETLVSMDVSWLRGMTGLVAQPLPLVLVGYHSQHGIQLIVEGVSNPQFFSIWRLFYLLFLFLTQTRRKHSSLRNKCCAWPTSLVPCGRSPIRYLRAGHWKQDVRCRYIISFLQRPHLYLLCKFWQAKDLLTHDES